MGRRGGWGSKEIVHYEKWGQEKPNIAYPSLPLNNDRSLDASSFTAYVRYKLLYSTYWTQSIESKFPVRLSEIVLYFQYFPLKFRNSYVLGHFISVLLEQCMV